MIFANFRDNFSCNSYQPLQLTLVMFFVGEDVVAETSMGEWMMVGGLVIRLTCLMMRFYIWENV